MARRGPPRSRAVDFFLAREPSMATSETSGRQPLPPAVRRRLQMCFETGNKAGSGGNFDYATDMFSMCVTQDPGNPVYVKSFLTNLQKKYGNSKKGAAMAGLKSAGSKASLKKSLMSKDWPGAIKSGLEVLKLNPWDIAALSDISKACEAAGYDESQLEYLRVAQESDPKDAEINRLLGRALSRQGIFDEAIAAFNRVLTAAPQDEEAMREIGNLSVRKTIVKGGYEGAETSRDVKARKNIATSDDGDEMRLSPAQRLERAIERDPSWIPNYVELSELYLKDELLDKAEGVLARALQASGGGDINIRERLEDVQIKRARQNMQIAEQKAKADGTPQAAELLQKMKEELNNKEMEVYSARAERWPTNLGFKYELALRLMKAKRIPDAIKLFQEARTDVKRKGHVLMGLGDCFYALKKYKLSLNHYEQAVEEISPREEDLLKAAIYKAARLAEGLQDWARAEKHLTHLAGLDFSYRDVSERLDKVAQLRENGGSSVADLE